MEVADCGLAAPELEAIVVIGEVTLEGIAVTTAIHEDFYTGAVDIDIQVEIEAAGGER